MSVELNSATDNPMVFANINLHGKTITQSNFKKPAALPLVKDKRLADRDIESMSKAELIRLVKNERDHHHRLPSMVEESGRGDEHKRDEKGVLASGSLSAGSHDDRHASDASADAQYEQRRRVDSVDFSHRCAFSCKRIPAMTCVEI